MIGIWWNSKKFYESQCSRVSGSSKRSGEWRQVLQAITDFRVSSESRGMGSPGISRETRDSLEALKGQGVRESKGMRCLTQQFRSLRHWAVHRNDVISRTGNGQEMTNGSHRWFTEMIEHPGRRSQTSREMNMGDDWGGEVSARQWVIQGQWGEGEGYDLEFQAVNEKFR